MSRKGDRVYITWLEMRKVLLSPVFLILLLLMIGFNLFSIWSDSYNREELQVVNKIIETYGPSFNDDILQTMERDINQLVIELGGTSTQAFLEEMTYEIYDHASSEEQHQIDHISLLYTYVQAAKELEARYTAIDIAKLKQDFLNAQTMPSWLEQKMANEFDNWHARFDEIVETNEYKQWFFLGEYGMHSKLFRSHMKTLAFEGVLIIALLTALIANYEFEHRTQLVTYATKKGRKLIWYKGFASLVCSLMVIAVLFGVTLGTYFTVYDYSTMWQIDISSGMNWEYTFPYITWWSISLWQYLLLAVVILTFVLIIVMLLTFTISVFVKNSYFTWLLSVLLLLAMYVMPTYFPNSTLQWMMHYNVTLLLLNPHQFFNGGTSFMMMQYHEFSTLLLWLLIASAGTIGAIRHFNVKDVV